MAERQNRHQHRVLVEAARRAAQPRVEHIVVMRARDQLRQRRGSARQQHRRDVARIGADARERRRSGRRGKRRIEQRGQRSLPGSRVTGDEDGTQRRCLRRELLRHRAVIEALDGVRNHIRDGARRAQEVSDLGVAVRAQRRDGNRADARQREIRVDECRNVRQLDDHAVLRADPGLDEAAGEPVDRASKRFVGDAFVAADEGDFSGAAESPAPACRST